MRLIEKANLAIINLIIEEINATEPIHYPRGDYYQYSYTSITSDGFLYSLEAIKDVEVEKGILKVRFLSKGHFSDGSIHRLRWVYINPILHSFDVIVAILKCVKHNEKW